MADYGPPPQLLALHARKAKICQVIKISIRQRVKRLREFVVYTARFASEEVSRRDENL